MSEMLNQRALSFVGAVSLAALAPMAAQAADMPQYTPPPVVTAVPTWDWTGFYAGLNAGYGWSSSDDVNVSVVDPGGAFFGPCLTAGACPNGMSYSRDGFVGGAQAGYNWQIDQFVVGFEADIEYTDMNGGGTVTTAVAPFANGRFTSTSDINWLATLRGRAGLAIDRTLLYVTGGLAVGGVEDTFRWGFPGVPQVYNGSNSDTEWGWTVGGGLDYAITDNIVLGAEVLYFDLGSTTVNGVAAAPFVAPAGTSMAVNYDHDGVIARARLSYKF
ncbi:outer membrane protein [Microbaculum sp. FT89]|uniref:outer membrane protein n=1 Tax=Microbaculum sp. FT89 TaxID=3447298 RepID=UPI003F52B164